MDTRKIDTPSSENVVPFDKYAFARVRVATARRAKKMEKGAASVSTLLTPEMQNLYIKRCYQASLSLRDVLEAKNRREDLANMEENQKALSIERLAYATMALAYWPEDEKEAYKSKCALEYLNIQISPLRIEEARERVEEALEASYQNGTSMGEELRHIISKGHTNVYIWSLPEREELDISLSR